MTYSGLDLALDLKKAYARANAMKDTVDHSKERDRFADRKQADEYWKPVDRIKPWEHWEDEVKEIVGILLGDVQEWPSDEVMNSLANYIEAIYNRATEAGYESGLEEGRSGY